MSDNQVFITYKGQAKFRDNWDKTFRDYKRRLNKIEKAWRDLPSKKSDENEC
jgi:hypothetical protein